MRGPSTSELLGAWERGLGQPAAERALALLTAGEEAAAVEDLAALPVGDRDGRLLDLRQWAFGTELTATARCPACSTELDLPFAVDSVRVPASQTPALEGTVEVAGHSVRFRVPDSTDSVTAATTGTLAGARRVLLERCVLAAECDGVPVAAVDLPPAVLERVQEAMAQHDPQADVQLVLTCLNCEHLWSAVFDIAAFLWAEVDQWARRVLVDVATLASAYGWTEAEVLRLGSARREAYLQLCGR